MKRLLGLESRVICIDVADQVEHFSTSEAELVIADLTGDFCNQVLRRYEPGFIFLDVHSYRLLREAIEETLKLRPQCVLAVHDCSNGQCNPQMTLAKNDPAVTSSTGVWERHVLAEVFCVGNPLDKRLDRIDTPSHRLRIFGTTHGLGVIAPRDFDCNGPSIPLSGYATGSARPTEDLVLPER